MAKETFYFSHDYGARNDPKLIKVLMKLGQEGKGVYWDLIEMMYEQDGKLELNEIESYAFSVRTNDSIINSLINDFGLFDKDSTYFWSNSVINRLDKRNEKSKTAKDNAQKRWGNPIKRPSDGLILFYIIELFNDAEKFIKCGITSESVSRRFSGKTKGYSYKEILTIELSTDESLNLEDEISNKFLRYNPLDKFPGYLECYDIREKERIINFAMQRECKGNAIKESKVKESKVNQSKINESKTSVLVVADATQSKIEKFESNVLEFKKSLFKFVDSQGGKYPAKTVEDFFNYWSEPNPSKTKMRYQLEKTFDTDRRLTTWANRDNNFKNGKQQTTNDRQERIQSVSDLGKLADHILANAGQNSTTGNIF